MAQLALATGANRGIGLDVCRQLAQQNYTVLLGARDLAKGRDAAQSLIDEGLDVRAIEVDVADSGSIERARQQVEQEFGHLDVLVNNAAILYDTFQSAVDAELDVVKQALETNTFGPWRMVQAFLPLLRRGSHQRIVNVSSEGGSLASMGGGTPAYSTSKAALNALTRMLAAELKSDGILVNSICPGWVATEMGGAGGRPIADGAASVVWGVTLPDDGPSGGFFRDGKSLNW